MYSVVRLAEGVGPINFQPVTLADKPVFDYYFRQRRYEGSECTFTNMFMWRRSYSIAWTREEDMLCIQAVHAGQVYVLPPYGPPEPARWAAVLDKMLDWFAEQRRPFVMRGVSQAALAMLERVRPGFFHAVPDRNAFDYVYNARDLMELKGAKYRNKRNHIYQFRKYCPQYKYLPLTATLVPQCIEYEQEWCRQRGCDKNQSLAWERDAIIELLHNFGRLDYQGGVIMIDGKVEAFTLGEALNEDTAVIHVEKANADIPGLYAAINQEFCRHAWPHMRFINREEDMGLPGLRKAKMSYHPVKMIEKYVVTVKA